MTRLMNLLVLIGLLIPASLALYHTSDHAQELAEQLHALNTQIEGERRSLHVLNAEWSYLASPEKLDEAARKLADLRPTTPRQIVSLADVTQIIPTRDAVAAAETTGKRMPTSVAERENNTSLAVASADDKPLRNRFMIRNDAGGDAIGDLIQQLDAR